MRSLKGTNGIRGPWGWTAVDASSSPRTRAVIPALLALVMLVVFAAPSSGLDGLSVPQSPMFHAASLADEPLVSKERQGELYRELKERFYSPWRQAAPRDAVKILEWVFDAYGKNVFGENLLPRSSSWVEEQRRQARVDAVGELNSHALSVRPTSLRLMPTQAPAFRSPALAGEGYPFDYLQNSAVHPGEPLFVSHLSMDGLWAWCDTSCASGWMETRDLAFVDEAAEARWMSLPLAVVVRENALLRDETGSLFRAKVGAMLPLSLRGIVEHLLVAPVRGRDGGLIERTVRVSASEAVPAPLAPSPWSLAAVAEELFGELYGWGGFLGNRDCSAMTRDILLPFGVWLPRNSRAQANGGRSINLEGMTNDEKKDLLKREGVPFLTLVGLPGHIMLYVGTWRGEPLVMHNMWGIRTEHDGTEGRYVIGRTVITTLDLGSDLPGHAPGKLLIDRIDRLAFTAD